MSYNPNNPNGQATSANSAPTVLPNDYASTVTSKITNGTNVADTLAGDTGFNSVVTSGGVKTLSFTTSAASAQTILPATDIRGYTWIEIYYTSVGVGLALTGQFATTSGGTYTSTSGFGTSNNAPTSALGVAVNTLYSGPTRGNYFQIAVSALTSGTFSGTVTLKAVAPVTPSVNANLNVGTQVIGKVGIDQTTPGTTNLVQVGGSLPTGANTIGKVSSATSTTGGTSTAKVASAATTNATSVKASAGTVYGWNLFNTSAVTQYIKLHNLATAPTVGTSGVFETIALPAGGGSNIWFGDLGIALGTGIAYSITTGVAETDATATAANAVVGAIYYA